MKTTQTIARSIIQREKVALALIGVTLMLAAFYAVLINQTILNVVEQRKAEGRISRIQKEIAELELTYIANENEINLGYAYENGFRMVDERHFVTRDTNLSLR